LIDKLPITRNGKLDRKLPIPTKKKESNKIEKRMSDKEKCALMAEAMGFSWLWNKFLFNWGNCLPRSRCRYNP
jgi:hypothetical protein